MMLINIVKKYFFNADYRKSNADSRRFNLRVSACNLRESALKRYFSETSRNVLI